MTLAIALVTKYGVWSSTDHRLTSQRGKLMRDNSVKHVVLRCTDGCVLLSYTGLGLVGRRDLSQWVREILRGESLTVDETLVDVREQATARLGVIAKTYGVPHVFLAGAYLAGHPWAVVIRNTTTPSALVPGGIQAVFQTAAQRADEPVLLVGGTGRASIQKSDWKLLSNISNRRPREPDGYMKLLGDINQRAASNQHESVRTVSRSCTVVFMPPEGEPVKEEWYGPPEEGHLRPSGVSHVLLGIDLNELTGTIVDLFHDQQEGRVSEDEANRRVQEASRRAVESRGRRSVRDRE